MTVINLNKVRKAKDKAAARTQADANTARFGQTKAEKALQDARDEKAQRDLEGHRQE